MNREEITIRMVKSSQLGKIDKHAGWNTSEKSKRACPSSDCSKRQLWVHCKFLPHENYRDWELQGPCRENPHYQWKRSCNYHGVSLQFLQPFSIARAGFLCRDPAIPSPNLQCRWFGPVKAKRI